MLDPMLVLPLILVGIFVGRHKAAALIGTALTIAVVAGALKGGGGFVFYLLSGLGWSALILLVAFGRKARNNRRDVGKVGTG